MCLYFESRLTDVFGKNLKSRLNTRKSSTIESCFSGKSRRWSRVPRCRALVANFTFRVNHFLQPLAIVSGKFRAGGGNRRTVEQILHHLVKLLVGFCGYAFDWAEWGNGVLEKISEALNGVIGIDSNNSIHCVYVSSHARGLAKPPRT